MGDAEFIESASVNVYTRRATALTGDQMLDNDQRQLVDVALPYMRLWSEIEQYISEGGKETFPPSDPPIFGAEDGPSKPGPSSALRKPASVAVGSGVHLTSRSPLPWARRAPELVTSSRVPLGAGPGVAAQRALPQPAAGDAEDGGDGDGRCRGLPAQPRGNRFGGGGDGDAERDDHSHADP